MGEKSTRNCHFLGGFCGEDGGEEQEHRGDESGLRQGKGKSAAVTRGPVPNGTKSMCGSLSDTDSGRFLVKEGLYLVRAFEVPKREQERIHLLDGVSEVLVLGSPVVEEAV